MFDWVSDVLQWLLDVLLWVPRRILQLLLDALAALINAIPVPSFMQNLNSDLSGVFGSVGWWADFVELPTGLGIVLTAYVLRFSIRRIPLIG